MYKYITAYGIKGVRHAIVLSINKKSNIFYTYLITVYKDDSNFFLSPFNRKKPREIVAIKGDNKLAIV